MSTTDDHELTGIIDEPRALRAPSSWRQGLPAHAAALGLVLFALIPWFDTSAPAFPDEGLYSAQAAALASGTWWIDRPATDIDDDGTASAMIGPSVVDGDRVVPYSRRPAYPLLLAPFFAVAGTAGLLAVSVLGTWTAAVCSALLARRIDHRYALPTLWLIGLGSPLLFSAYLVMGHSIAAGLAGLVLLGLAAVVDDRSNRWILPTALAAAALVLVRSEGTIMLLAVCLALAVTSVGRDPWRLRPRPLAMSAVLAVVGAGAYALNGIAARAVSADLIGETGSVVDQTGPLTVAWTDLLRPWFGTGSSATPSLPLVALACVLAAAALRIAPRRVLLPIGLLWLGAVAAVVRHFEEFDLVSGLLPTFPVAAALLLLRWTDLVRPPVARLALVSAAATAGLLLTVYASESSPQWGGRFFQLILPAVGPLVVIGMDRGRSAMSRKEGFVALGAIVILTLSMSLFAFRMNHDSRAYTSTLVGQTVAFADQNGEDDPLVVVARLTPDGVSRWFWRPWKDGREILSTPDFGVLLAVLQHADRSGRDQVVVVSEMPPQVFGRAKDTLKSMGWEVTESQALLPTAFWAIRLEPVTG